MHFYPNIELSETKFQSISRMYFLRIILSYLYLLGRMWDPQTRKFIFDNFAEKNTFDPLVPENWKSTLHLLEKDKVHCIHF